MCSMPKSLVVLLLNLIVTSVTCFGQEEAWEVERRERTKFANNFRFAILTRSI